LRLLPIQPPQLMDGGGSLQSQKDHVSHQSLLALVSLNPPEFQVAIIDEYFENVPFDDPADIIRFSFMTPPTPRASQIGDKFHRLGKKAG
jgi:hypothetical protein